MVRKKTKKEMLLYEKDYMQALHILDSELLQEVKNHPHEKRKVPIRLSHRLVVYVAPERINKEFINRLKIKYNIP